MIKQKDGVFNTVAAVRGTSTFTSAVTLTDTERKSVVAALVTGLTGGNIEYKGDRTDKVKVASYASGLLSNWLRKDKRLNGGTTYTAKNPGSRTGAGDDTLKAMRTLLGATTDDAARVEIQQEIDRRVAALKAPKTAEVNVAALPEELRHLVAQ